MNSIAALILGFRDGFERDQSRALRLLFAGMAVVWVALLGALIAFSVPVFQREWPDIFIGQFSLLTTDVLRTISFDLMPVMLVALFFALGLWPYSSVWLTSRSVRAFARALLGAVDARDLAITPEISSGAASAQELQEDTDTRIALAHPMGELSASWWPIAQFIGVLYLVTGIFLVAPEIGQPQNRGIYSGFLVWSFAIPYWSLGVYAFIAGVILRRFNHIAQAGYIATVDSAGLTLRRERGQPHARRIQWGEARGFARIDYTDQSEQLCHVYILSADNERFIWYEPGDRPDVSEDARRLVALIERHTHLPLLDLSRAINTAYGATYGGQTLTTHGYAWSVAERALSVARASGDEALAHALLERLRPAGPLSWTPRGLPRLVIYWGLRKRGILERQNLLDLARALLPYYPYPATPDAPIPQAPLNPSRRFLAAARLTLLQVAALGLVIACFYPIGTNLATAILKPLYSQSLLAALPARVHAETPLYFASFTSPTPGWAIRAATKDDSRSARFTPQGYELALDQSVQSLQDNNNIEWNPSLQMPADGAIEVTVSVTPAVGGGSNSPAQVTPAGILFDGSADGARAHLFEVDSYGDWTLYRCHDLNDSGLGCSDFMSWSDGSSYSDGPLASRPGGSTTFHLLLIRHGRTYLLYANGAFLAAYHDDTGPAAPSGAIGLYLDSQGNTAHFTDLAVYPLPTGIPFWTQ